MASASGSPSVVRLPDKNKFVSTPLFNVQTASSSPSSASPTTSGNGGVNGNNNSRHYQHFVQQQHPPHPLPASFSCHEALKQPLLECPPRTKAATSLRPHLRPPQERLLTTQAEREMMAAVAATASAGNGFYAATDIFKVRLHPRLLPFAHPLLIL